MLINFSIANWKSFRDETSFTMVASKERQYRERLTHIKKYNLNVLPVTSIYGGNASGKTNFIDAMAFAKRFISTSTDIDKSIPVNLFKLDPTATGKPSEFRFEILVGDAIYEYYFSLTRQEVIDERLVKFNKSNDTVQCDRRQAYINPNLEDYQMLEFALKGTRKNLLFLTNSVSQNVQTFRDIYEWFKRKLQIVGPNSSNRYVGSQMISNESFSTIFKDILYRLDTGISAIKYNEIPIEKLGLPEEFASAVTSDLEAGAGEIEHGETILFHNPFAENGPYAIEIGKREGKLVYLKPEYYHCNSENQEVKFDISEESSGSRRALDLIPMLCDLLDNENDSVYFIDEIDRSLHTLLTREILKLYLNHCEYKKRSQLVFTTHDPLLMDQSIFRRDEMWVAERDSSGSSTLFSFNKYKDIRYDNNITKSYLQGRLGGVPKIFLSDCLNFNRTPKE